MTESARSQVMCLWAACDRPATHDGFCAEHRELTDTEARLVAASLQAAKAREAVVAFQRKLRAVVNAERRAMWRKADAHKRSRRRMQRQSKRKQR